MARSAEPDVRHRVGLAVDELDQAVRTLRDTIFALDHQLQGRGMRHELVVLGQEIAPAPEFSFTGPVDGALPPGQQVQLIGLLREAVEVIRPTAAPARIEVIAGPVTYRAIVETAGWPEPGPAGTGADLAGLRHRAAQASVTLDAEATTAGLRLTWQVPLQDQVLPPDRAPSSQAGA
jgi:signal transduction histidine kinase